MAGTLLARVVLAAGLFAGPALAAGAAPEDAANHAPFVAGGNAELLPLGDWRLWIDAGDGNGPEDVVAAEVVLTDPEGARRVALEGPLLVGAVARFEVDVQGGEGLRWTDIVLRDRAGAEVTTPLPRSVALSEPGSTVQSTGAGFLPSVGVFLPAIAILAAIPGVWSRVHRRRQ